MTQGEKYEKKGFAAAPPKKIFISLSHTFSGNWQYETKSWQFYDNAEAYGRCIRQTKNPIVKFSLSIPAMHCHILCAPPEIYPISTMTVIMVEWKKKGRKSENEKRFTLPNGQHGVSQ